jgi:Mce-associated membrane protein
MTKIDTVDSDAAEEINEAVPVDIKPAVETQTTEGAAKAKPVDDSAADAEPDDEDDDDGKEVTNDDTLVPRGIRWGRVLTYGVLPALVLLLAVGAGYLKWLDGSVRNAQFARIESVRAATDSTVALLSYKPDTVEKDLGVVRDRLTGTFKDAYTSLTHDVVIPSAQQKHISAVATAPAAAWVSSIRNHSVVLVFVDQTVTIGNDAPTSTASAVKVTLDKIDERWLISGFDPV